MTGVCVLLVTAPHEGDVAARLARELVTRRLAACVNVVPRVRSVYRWEGAVQDDIEDLLVIKTLAANVPALSAFVDEHHPYDVPEVIVLPVTDGATRYLDWVMAESTSAIDETDR